MNKIVARYLTLNLALFFMLLLILFSITGAFLGADRAGLFFNSPPLAVFWILLTALFAAGFVFWKSLRRRPFLLLCHAGCVAVLLGGLGGSSAAHRLLAAAGGEARLTQGVMMLRQGQADRQVYRGHQHEPFELPFIVHLAETDVSYYDEPSIGIYARNGKLIGVVPAIVGDTVQISDPDGSTVNVTVTQRFENLRLQRDEDGMTGVEGPPDRRNPGCEVVLTLPDGSESRQYVFERIEPSMWPEAPFLARYLPPHKPKEYKSLLKIERDGQIVREKTIRVNDPLYYSGYHFYQSTFGQDEIGPYSGIMVVSNRGVGLVFFGYALLSAGLFGQYWILPLRRRRSRGAADAD